MTTSAQSEDLQDNVVIQPKQSSFIAPLIFNMAHAKNGIDSLIPSGTLPDSEDADALNSLYEEASDILRASADACMKNVGFSLFEEFPATKRLEFKMADSENPIIEIIPIGPDGVVDNDVVDSVMHQQTQQMLNAFAASCMDVDTINALFDNARISPAGVITRSTPVRSPSL